MIDKKVIDNKINFENSIKWDQTMSSTFDFDEFDKHIKLLFDNWMIVDQIRKKRRHRELSSTFHSEFWWRRIQNRQRRFTRNDWANQNKNDVVRSCLSKR